MEGSSDRRAIARILAELHENAGRECGGVVIDSADQLRSGEYPPLGNRALVERAYQTALSENVFLNAVVDREYRKFQTVGNLVDELPYHYVVEPSLFWTRGHSFENYFFTVECVIKFLKQQHSEDLALGAIEAVIGAFDSILRWTSAATVAIKEQSLIERAAGLCQVESWHIGGDLKIGLNAADYAEAFRTRGVGADEINKLEISINDYFVMLRGLPDTQLAGVITHGHLGWELIWCGVAAALQPYVLSAPTSQSIAFGHKEHKARVASDFLAEQVARGEEILPGLWKSLGFAE